MSRNQEYWTKRMTDLEASLHRDAEAVVADLETMYRGAERQIEADLSRWYGRFANNNGVVSMADARKLLTSGELKEFKWTLKEYEAHARDNGNGQWNKELENASARWHISRLESLKYQLQNTVEELAGGQSDALDVLLKQTYQNGYGQTAFIVQSGLGVGWDFTGLSVNQIKTALQKPWALDGRNFSDRIWENKQALVGELHKQLTQNLMTGGDLRKVIDDISKKFNTSYNNAARLVYTESAYVRSVSSGESYRALGVEKVYFIAVLDERTSQICQSMDGSVIDIKDYQPGVTVPPLHPWCRSTTAPYYKELDGIGERAARDPETGKTYFVPRNMTYPEWEKTFMNDNPEEGSKLKEKLTEAVNGVAPTAIKVISDPNCELAKKLGIKTYEAMQQMVEDCGNDDLKQIWNEQHTNIRVGSTNKRSKQYCVGQYIHVNAKGNPKGDSFNRPHEVTFHESGHAIDHLLQKKVSTKPFHASALWKDGLFPNTIKDEVQALVDERTAKAKADWDAHKGDWKWLTDNGYIEGYRYWWYQSNGYWQGRKDPELSQTIGYKMLEKEIRALPDLSMASLSDMLEGATNGRVSCGFGHGKNYWTNRTREGVSDGLATEAFAEMVAAECANSDSLDTIKQYLPKSYGVFCDMLKDLHD